MARVNMGNFMSQNAGQLLFISSSSSMAATSPLLIKT
jgi:hypothetical protein